MQFCCQPGVQLLLGRQFKKYLILYNLDRENLHAEFVSRDTLATFE